MGKADAAVAVTDGVMNEQQQLIGVVASVKWGCAQLKVGASRTTT